MKLRRITIHNIASIEDAVIPFDAAPLSDAPLFLITGPTGAGKSTVLDAICLCLFGDTPRLVGGGEANVYVNDRFNTPKNKGQSDVRLMENNYIQLNSKGQLLRRGAGEGWCELLFETDDGEAYSARWSVARAYGRSDGKMQKPNRMLTNLKTGQTVEKHVNQEVFRLIGLTFDEFCRTTMLAQGEFTKFIQSSSKEKSDILEKLTGTGIYSEISKKIAETFSAKKADYEQKKMLLNSIKLLTEKEKEEKREAIDGIQHSVENLDRRGGMLTKRHDWLRTSLALQTQVTAGRESLDALVRRQETEGYRDEERLIADFQTSREALSWMHEAKILEKDIHILRQDEATLIGRYKQLETAYANVAEVQEQAKSTQQRLREMMLDRQAHQSMYEAGAMLEEKMSTLKKTQAKKVKRLVEMEATEKRLPLLSSRVTDLQQRQDAQTTVVQGVQKNIEDMASRREQLHPDEVQRQNAMLHQQATTIAEAQGGVSLLESLLHGEKEAREVYDAHLAEHENLRKRQAEDNDALQQARQRHEKATQIYEQWRDSLSNSFKLIRATLTRGQVCPLCRQELSADHVDDPDYDTVLQPVIAERDKADEELVAAKTRVETTDALLRKSAKETERLEKILDKTSSQAVRQRQTVIGLCQKANIELETTTLEPDEMRRALGNVSLTVNRQLDEVSHRLEAISGLDREIAVLRKQSDDAQQLLTATQKELGKAEKEWVKAQKTLDLGQDEVSLLTTEIQQMMTSLRELMTDPGWEDKWTASPDDYIRNFKTAYTEYADVKKRESTLTSEINVRETTLTTIRSLRASTHQLFPALKSTLAVDVASVSMHEGKLADAWQDYLLHLQEWTKALAMKSDSLSQYEQKTADFITSHPQMTMERLVALASHPSHSVDQLIQLHQQHEERMAMAKGALTNLESQLKQHEEVRPQMDEGDTIETLENALAQVAQERNRLQQEMGRIKSELADDEQKVRQSAQAVKETEKSRVESERWERVNQEFGSTDGTKFSRIAQSFILSYLLERANVYLRQFSDRYELVCDPGSLALLVRDRFSNQSPQFVKVLSGGESFMVSLSLALALSRLNKRKSNVDILFIDEGFGSLDEDCLNSVMDTLERLHQIGGQRVGVISHVEALKERIGTQIVVDRVNPSKSKVTISTA